MGAADAPAPLPAPPRIGESERLGRDIEMVLAGQVGELRIGLGPALRPVFLPRFAEAMAVRWPRLKVRLDVDRRERLQDDFRAGRYDILIAAYAEELPKADFVQTEVFRSPIVAVASPDHPLAQAGKVSIAEFLRYPNAGASTPSMLTAQGAVGDVPAGVRQDSMIECTDDATLKRLAKLGLATVFIQRHEAQVELDAGDLVILPIPWRMTLVLTATTTRAASHSPLLQQVVGLARKVGSELYDPP